MIIRQAFIHGPYDLRIDPIEFADEPLAPDEILVRTQVTALSTGTDVGNYVGDSSYIPGSPPYPRAIGYSNVGVVTQVGARVTGFQVGQRVFTTKRHASWCRVRTTELMAAVPDGVPAEQAALSFIAQLGLAALRQAHYEPGETVAIVGLGVIGLCTVALARALGANVIAIGNSEKRLGVAAEMGVKCAILSAPDGVENAVRAACSGGLADVVVLTANSWEAYRLSMQIARFGGRVAILGFPGRYEGPPAFNPLDPSWFWAKRLAILGSGFDKHADCDMADRRFTTRRNLEYILALLGSGSVNFAPLITHRLPAEEMKTAYDLAAAHDKDLITAIFRWDEVNPRPQSSFGAV